MNRRRLILLLLAASVLGITAGRLFRPKREPYYGGHPLSHWVEAHVGSRIDASSGPPAEEAIRRIGTNAIPHLLAWIHYEIPPGRLDRMERINSRLEWLRAKLGGNTAWEVPDPEWNRAQAAALAFVALGAGAAPAVPELARLLNQHQTTPSATRAATALGSLGDLGVPSLLAALTNPSPVIRARAAGSFGASASHRDNPVVGAALGKALQDDEWGVSSSAWSVVMSLKVDPQIIVPALIEKLQGSRPHSRATAAHFLWIYGASARPAVPQLTLALDDPDEGVRQSATNALFRIAPELLTDARQSW